MAKAFVNAVSHCRVIGLKVTDAGPGQLTLELPYQNSIVGNPDTGIIHGGALTTLMDTACGFCIQLALEEFQPCPTLDLRIDYMRAAKPGESVFGSAEVYRMTENVIFTKGIAYQGAEKKIIAHCVAAFMRLQKKTD